MRDVTNGTLCLIFLEIEGAFKPIGGQISHSDTLSTGLIDITNKVHEGNRTFLEGEGLQELAVDAEIYFTNDEAYQLLRSMISSKVHGTFLIQRGASGVNDTVDMRILSISDIATDNGARVSNVTFGSTQPFEFTHKRTPQLPLITLDPWDRIITKGQSLLLHSRAINWESCQWYFQPQMPEAEPTGPFAPIPDATSFNLRFTPETARGWTGNYKVQYCNSVGCVESEVAYIEILYQKALLSARYPWKPFDALDMVVSSVNGLQLLEVAVPVSYSDSVDSVVSTLDVIMLRDQKRDLEQSDDLSGITSSMGHIKLRSVLNGIGVEDTYEGIASSLTGIQLIKVGIKFEYEDDLEASSNISSIQLIGA